MQDAKQVLDKCCLLELPAELRNWIIELYLRRLHPGGIVTVQTPARTSEYHARTQPRLALVNRQLRTGTLSLFYRLDAFDIGNLYLRGQWEVAKRWLKANDHRLGQIQMIKMYLCEIHLTVLRIRAPSGKTASCDFDWKDTSHSRSCRTVHGYLTKESDLKALCDSVGTKGFTADDYIRAAEIYLAAMPRPTCFDLTKYSSDSEPEDEGWSVNDDREVEGHRIWRRRRRDVSEARSRGW